MSETTGIVIKNVLDSEIVTPAVGKTTMGFNNVGNIVTKDSDGDITKYLTTNETHYAVTLTQDTAVNLCVDFDGGLPDSETGMLGVCEAAALNTATINVRFAGITNVVLGVDAAIVAGDRLTSNGSGKVKKATSVMPVIGRALTAGDTTDDVIVIRLGY